MTIELVVHGKYATGPCLVDKEDASRLDGKRLYAKPNGYVFFQIRKSDGKLKNVYVHRFLINAPDGMDVDHKSGFKRDNQKSNLRVCTRSQNMANMKRRGKGVSHANGRWRAYIMVDYRQIYLGSHDTKEEASAAYDAAAKKHFGEFASMSGAARSG